VLCVSKSVCLFVILVMLSAPVIACALPGQEMSAAEQDCCLHMMDECGNSQMMDAHTCCTKTPQVAATSLTATSKYAPAVHQVVHEVALCAKPALVAGIFPRLQNLPDGSLSPPGSISILRI
jgi:hypothetical protein